MMAGTEMDPMLPGPASRTTRLPLILDVFLNISQLFVLLVAIATAVLSFMAKVDFITIVIRTAIAILAVGLPAFLLNYLIGKYYVQATLEELSGTHESKAESKSTQTDGSEAGNPSSATGEMDTQV